MRTLKRTWPFHVMLLPAIIFLIIFSYVPMGGIVMAFQNYKPWLGISGSEWVGLDNFRYLFEREDSLQVIWNTLIIAVLKLIFNLFVPFVFAILLNEVRKMAIQRTIQTLVYLPHFLSWVILGGILIDLLSTGGLVNRVLVTFGLGPYFFLGDNSWFRPTIILTDVWKEFGYNMIVFLAALAGINPALYEAAEIDGAGRWKQTLHITIPSLVPMLMVVGTLALGNVLNAGFDQIFNLYNPLVYQTGDIIDTFVYRSALENGEMGFATAIGLFKSVISMVLILISYSLAKKYAGYRIF
ncbi:MULTISPECIES: ABC transporter permease [unclassified Paenibacillus]|uniref:ABC transporter permease n=1 Tax=unclassified Paenibacillus TaxID=185978 RepID=UPI0009A61BBF|nr:MULTISPECIES: ABC transporter permease subunit [unclassified Paenibacillus]SLJ98853.1 carbohydrate ABC transporter membrane protein 1, CUT1 family [Paenibacillus sp. RU5A]SOC66703.1 carbohydrate ABC transporter membrane protein 1, CUT1 family [Paenibacillus sp. RU26A]SOC70197.1 carbohydrate ABC transporter membrane protein 1, CUT1 family [Paenibacillus sp. RU5M]